MSRPFIAAALLLASVAVAALARAEAERDPARIEGTWNYRTRSNCGTVEGVGQVTFRWNAQTGTYDERGQVYWSDSGSTIRWWGSKRFEASARRLVGRVRNSLGDTVDGHWDIEGAGPDRLVVRWTQTNGCRGEGIATRR